jgi:glycosyltransferase involved in cell wall biosynthesis
MPPLRYKLHINARFLGNAHQTGTHRSSTRFLKSIVDSSEGVPCVIHGDRASADRAHLTSSTPVEVLDTGVPGHLSKHVYEQLQFPRIVGEDFALHMMNTGPFILPNRKQILIIHDLNPFKCKDSFSKGFRAWNWFACKQAIKRSFHVISFSKYVTAEIQREFNFEPHQLSTIYQGPGLDIPVEFKSDFIRSKSKYFLCVGSLQPHKNLLRVLEAWKQTGLSASGYQLKIIGKQQAGFQDLKISPDLLSDSSIEFTGYVSDAELIQLYREATALVYPSIEEGFGLPVVEAFYLGCPVITSSRSCLPEIAGDAACLVDPFSIQEIADAMLQIASDQSLRERLIELGRERQDLFSWERAGREFWQIISRLEAFESNHAIK